MAGEKDKPWYEKVGSTAVRWLNGMGGGRASSTSGPTPAPLSTVPNPYPTYGNNRPDPYRTLGTDAKERQHARIQRGYEADAVNRSTGRYSTTSTAPSAPVDTRTPQQKALDDIAAMYGPYVDPMAGFDVGQYTDRSEAALDAYLRKQQQDFTAREAALAGMFNTNEDPAARALLNQQLADLTARGQAAQQSVNTAYSQGSDTVRQIAADIAAGAQQSATDVNDAYLNAAAQASAANRGMAGAVSAQFSGLGVSPQQAAALDAVALMEAQAPREAALARTLGQISSESTNRQAMSMADQLAAQQSALTSAVASAAAQASQSYTSNEMDRQRAEANAYRDAVMDVWGQRSAATSAADQQRMDIANRVTEFEMGAEQDRRMGQWEWEQRQREAAVGPFAEKYLDGLTAGDTSGREAAVSSITRSARAAIIQNVTDPVKADAADRALGVAEELLIEAARFQPDRAAALAVLNELYTSPEAAAMLKAIIDADPTFPRNQAQALAKLGFAG
jgi:hypothetical protein